MHLCCQIVPLSKLTDEERTCSYIYDNSMWGIDDHVLYVFCTFTARIACSVYKKKKKKKVQYRAVPAQVEQQVFSTCSFQNQTQTVDVT